MSRSKRPKIKITERKREEKHFLMTMTGEPYQLARIHYDVMSRSEIAKVFSRLKCMDYVPAQQRWVWLYHGETKKLKFNWPYSSIPQDKHPIVLGSFFSQSENEMFLNVNSFDRATKGIAFFDQYFREGLIKKALAKVTDIEIVNKYFGPSADGSFPRHEDFFDKQAVSKTDPEAVMKELKMIASSAEDREEGAKLVLSFLEEGAKQPFPMIERLPTHFYEDGIEGLESSLRMRQAIAYQHRLGNTGYTYYDLVHESVGRLPDA